MITKNLVNNMYDEKTDGIVHFKDFINPNELKEIMKEVNENRHLFIKKEEKYIENNQDYKYKLWNNDNYLNEDYAS